MSDTLKTAAALQLGVDPSTIRSVRMAANPNRPETNCEITQAITGSKVWIHLDEPAPADEPADGAVGAEGEVYEPGYEPGSTTAPGTGTEPETEPATSYEDMTVAELDEILRALEQPTTGNKADKVARLTAQGDTPT